MDSFVESCPIEKTVTVNVVAVASADITLLDSPLRLIPETIQLARRAVGII